LDDVNSLLSGTGFGILEYHVRSEAKKRSINNIAVIDHWTNYRERFIRNNNEELPKFGINCFSFKVQLFPLEFFIIKFSSFE